MIKELIKQDMYSAMKNQDHKKKNILSFMLGNILKVEKDRKSEISDDDVISVIRKEIKQFSVIRKEIKQREETRSYAEKANNQSMINECNFAMINECNFAIKTLNTYVPKMMNEDEINDFLTTIFSEIEPVKSNKGKIMKSVSILKDKADMKVVSQLVDRNLQ